MEAAEAAAEAKQQPTDEQRARAADAKRRGNEQYGKGEYEGALASYAEALAELPPDAAGAEAAALHSNSAMCHIKAERWDDAKASCTRALAAEPNNAKALLRRSLANERLDDLPGAHDDAEAAAKATAEAGGSLHNDALKTARRLKPLADAKREEMKEEVLGQLKVRAALPARAERVPHAGKHATDSSPTRPQQGLGQLCSGVVRHER